MTLTWERFHIETSHVVPVSPAHRKCTKAHRQTTRARDTGSMFENYRTGHLQNKGVLFFSGVLHASDFLSALHSFKPV